VITTQSTAAVRTIEIDLKGFMRRLQGTSSIMGDGAPVAVVPYRLSATALELLRDRYDRNNIALTLIGMRPRKTVQPLPAALQPGRVQSPEASCRASRSIA
jgi:hypothetical protein